MEDLDVARYFSHILQARRLNQKEIAKKLEFSEGYVSNLINGKQRLSLETAAVVNDVLQIPFEDLLPYIRLRKEADYRLATALISASKQNSVASWQKQIEIAKESEREGCPNQAIKLLRHVIKEMSSSSLLDSGSEIRKRIYSILFDACAAMVHMLNNIGQPPWPVNHQDINPLRLMGEILESMDEEDEEYFEMSARFLYWKADTLHLLGRWKDTLEFAEQAAILEPSDPVVNLLSHRMKAMSFAILGQKSDYDDAAYKLEEVIATYERKRVPRWVFGMSYEGLARGAEYLNEDREILPYLEKSNHFMSEAYQSGEGYDRMRVAVPRTKMLAMNRGILHAERDELASVAEQVLAEARRIQLPHVAQEASEIIDYID